MKKTEKEERDSMNKSEFISALAEKTNLMKKDIDSMLDAFFETIGEALKQGDDVRFTGFGSFAVSKQPERTGRNPRTGERIKIPAKNMPKFKAGRNLKEICQ